MPVQTYLVINYDPSRNLTCQAFERERFRRRGWTRVGGEGRLRRTTLEGELLPTLQLVRDDILTVLAFVVALQMCAYG